MSYGSVVYSNGSLQDTDGEISFSHHTYCLYIANVDTNHWIEVKLNGGPWSVWVPEGNNHQHGYIKIPGDYTKIQVMTASSTVSVYAIG
jgi:hypothetical protein